MGSIAALRLDRSRQAYHDHDLITALIEAEELLEAEPDNVDALEVLGDTELELGHGREAELVFTQLLDLNPDQPLYLTGQAIARFLHTDFEGSVQSGMKALETAPELPEAHAYAGLSLERLGRLDESDSHLDRATELSPDDWAAPPSIRDVPWSELLTRAMNQVPDSLQGFFERVPFVWQDLPDPNVLRSTDPPISPLVLAMYEGRPEAPGEETGLLPRSMRIFQGNARRFAGDMDRLAEDLAQALSSEAADWLGLPPPDIAQATQQDAAPATDAGSTQP